jgi:hypothetical protein
VVNGIGASYSVGGETERPTSPSSRPGLTNPTV